MADHRTARLFARLEPLRRGPLRGDAFRSRLHEERTAATLGIVLGVAFGICFLTGLVSHGIQRGPTGVQELWRAGPVSLYRVTQGLHLLTGIVSIPLLLLKLWVVYPRLWSWPPFRDLTHLVERLSLVALVGGALFQLATGLMNVFYWYAFPFNFPNAHYAGSYIAIGGLVTHIGAKWHVTRRALRAPAAPPAMAARVATGSLTRRGLLVTAGAAAAGLLVTTLGSVWEPLSRLAILAPRRAGDGPQGLPVNRTATPETIAAGRSADYRLAVAGNVPRPFELTLDELRALPRVGASLPIACVEGWSTGADWSGVRVRDLLDRAGAAPDAVVRVVSLQREGSSRSTLYPNHARDPRTLMALELNGEELHPDHGWPTRLIGPNRPGTQQTKWVARLEVV